MDAHSRRRFGSASPSRWALQKIFGWSLVLFTICALQETVQHEWYRFATFAVGLPPASKKGVDSARLRAVSVDAPPTVETSEAQDGTDELPAPTERPGFLDQANFHLAPSVADWRTFENRSSGLDDFMEPTDFTLTDAPYWMYHLGRSAFFILQGAGSLVAAQVSSTLAPLEGAPDHAETSVVPSFLRKRIQSPELVRKLLRRVVQTFRQDLGYIKAGYFKFPYDMSPRHQQFSPLHVAGKSLQYFREAVAVARRSATKSDATLRSSEAAKDVYPDYYRHAFHHQSDGWLSSESADVYEISTETLFLGRQDAMQRTGLVHLAKFLGDSRARPPRADKTGAGIRLLEVACGTGRFMTFIRDNWPAMDVTASDLSPFYVDAARQNNQYWEKRFAPASGVKRGKAKFVQANAEALPFAAEEFDVIMSTYLFHELPPRAQDNVVAEVFRVLAPGGLFVLTDSMQLGDQPVFDSTLASGDGFQSFAEPHYRAYIRRDLAELARSHGLQPLAKEISTATKSLSFIKPKPEEAPKSAA